MELDWSNTTLGFLQTDLEGQEEELSTQPSFMKFHAFPRRIQDQSLQASASQQPFPDGCLMLACMMGQKVARSCTLLAHSSLGCHQFLLSDVSSTVPFSLPPSHSLQDTLSPQGLKPALQSPQQNGCCTRCASGKQPPHGNHMWGASGKYLPQVKGLGSASKWLPQANGRHMWGTAGKWGPQRTASHAPAFTHMPCSAEGCRTHWNRPT